MKREVAGAKFLPDQAAQDAAMTGLTVGHRIAVETPDFTHGTRRARVG